MPWARVDAGYATTREATGAPRRQRSVGTPCGNGYVVTEGPSPHVQRARELIKRHPEVRDYFGPYPTVGRLHRRRWSTSSGDRLAPRRRGAGSGWSLAAYLVGAFASHALFVLIHDASHNLIVKATRPNRLLGILCNVGQGFPSAMSFRTYHLLHHFAPRRVRLRRRSRLPLGGAARRQLAVPEGPLAPRLRRPIETVRPLRIQEQFADPWLIGERARDRRRPTS